MCVHSHMGKSFSNTHLVHIRMLSGSMQNFDHCFPFFLILFGIDPFSTSTIHSYKREQLDPNLSDLRVFLNCNESIRSWISPINGLEIIWQRLDAKKDLRCDKKLHSRSKRTGVLINEVQNKYFINWKKKSQNCKIRVSISRMEDLTK